MSNENQSPSYITLNGHAARRVILTGATNVRHIGGFETADGRFTLPNLFFRADSLHRLSAADQQLLLDRGVRTVIDLRSPGEQRTRPNLMQNHLEINYRHIPLHGSEVTLPQPTDQLSGMALYYGFLLAQCQPGLSETFAILAQPGALPALVHCTAGKDRTGMVTALVLDLLGVPAVEIVADYALSRSYIEPIRNELIAQGVQDGFDAAEYAAFLESPPEAMADTLTHLRKEYGGAHRFLEKLGLSAAHLERLQKLVTLRRNPPLPRQ